METKLTKTPTGVIYSFDYSEEIADFDQMLQNLRPTDETLRGLVRTGILVFDEATDISEGDWASPR